MQCIRNMGTRGHDHNDTEGESEWVGLFMYSRTRTHVEIPARNSDVQLHHHRWRQHGLQRRKTKGKYRW